MPHRGANTFVGGDANTGGGYGKIPAGGGEQKKAKIWPYSEVTPEEIESLLADEETEDDRATLHKKRSRYEPSDHIGQANYRPHAFVKGSTRGLTGIMAGRAFDDLRELMREVGFTAAHGQAGRSYSMMGPFDARTRPGRRTGSKKGWFGPPSPKPTDPEAEDRAYTLKDIGEKDEEKPIRLADRERRRHHSTESTQEESLRTFLKHALDIV